MAKKKGKLGKDGGKGRGKTTKKTGVTSNTAYGSHAGGSVPLTGGGKKR